MTQKKDESRGYNFLFLLSFFVTALSFSTLSYASDIGVDKDIKDAANYMAQVGVAYEVAGNRAMVNMPSSVAAVTCLNKAVTATSEISGEMFSGKVTESMSKTLENDLKSHFKNFSWDNYVSYDTDIKADIGVKVSLEVNIGNDGGPNVKGFECDNLGKIWDAENNAAGSNFPSLTSALASLLTGGQGLPDDDEETGGKKFSKELKASTTASEAAEKFKEKEGLIEAKDLDIDFNGRETPCQVLTKMMNNSEINCDDVKQK